MTKVFATAEQQKAMEAATTKLMDTAFDYARAVAQNGTDNAFQVADITVGALVGVSMAIIRNSLKKDTTPQKTVEIAEKMLQHNLRLLGEEYVKLAKAKEAGWPADMPEEVRELMERLGVTPENAHFINIDLDSED